MTKLVISGAEKIRQLQNESAKLPQLELRTEHYFADGCYVRQIYQPKGVLVVGKQHKREHLVILQSGHLAIVNGDEHTELEGPVVIIAPAGSKRAILALTDSVYLNVHRTENTDLEQIEIELVEPDESALFDAHNQLKPILLSTEE